MDKTPDNELGKETDVILTPCVAYTLNNYQPVRSTIIGEQPLFYMDYEDEIEDEFDEIFGLDVFEKEALSLEERLTALGEDVLSSGTLTDIFSTEADFFVQGSTKKKSSLNEILDCLGKSRLAQSFMDFAKNEKITILFSKQIQTSFYDRDAGKIFLNVNLAPNDLVLLCARELRRVWQDKKGALVSPLSLHPDHAVLVHRAQIADLNTTMVRIAWELQLAGEKGPWTRIENSSLHDLGRALAREAHINFRTLDQGTACASVFESWFLSERCQHEDRKLIQQMLSDYRNYAFEDVDISAEMTNDIIAALGSMPYGKNYLAPYVSTIIADALFTEVRDRANANFLWFIKFERSFSEAEQELQKEKTINSHGLTSGASCNNENQEWSNNEKDTNIIPLLCDPDAIERQDKPAGRSRAGGIVVPFRSL